MTKLNVVIPANEVTVGNVTYRKVDRKAQAGDIVKALEESVDITEGAFYSVHTDGDGDPYVIDDMYDASYGLYKNPEEFEVYAPVFAVTTELPSAAEITFDNAQYRKVDRSAREGDVIILRSAPFEEYDITQGTPYEVTRVDSSDDPHIKDDEGGDYDTCDDVFDVYEKVSVETTLRGVQYREVKRQARAGEMIKMMDDDGADGWAEGDTFIVAKIDSDGDAVFKDNDGDTRYKDTDYYVVLEPVNAQAKAENKAEPARLTVGDYAKVVNPKAYREHRRGQIVEIFEDVHDRQPFKARSLIDGGENWYCEHEIILATAEEVSAAKAAAQAEAQRKAAIGPFACGGFAQIVDRTKSLAMSAADTDGYVKVSVEPYGKYALSLKKPNGEYSGYCNADALRQITEEEYNAATAPKPKFNVGDSVQINVPESETTRYGRANVKNSEVGTVTKVSGERITVTFPSYGGGWDGIASELTKVSAEEASTIEKEAQEIARLNAIGRKVGEFKCGDIVAVTDGYGELVSGDIGVITEADGSDLPGVTVRGVQRYVSVNLITPVEQRFDMEQAAA
jgi:hypothetical protein